MPYRRQPWETDLHYAGTDRVWQLWHTVRIEDLVSNILLANQDQIFNDDWQKKIGSLITDTGNALEAGEAIKFGKAIRPEALYDYMIEVGMNHYMMHIPPCLDNLPIILA